MADSKPGYSNIDMLENQANTISHHAEELQDAVKKSDEVMPWVITKAQRASTDLSDITHYLEGEQDEYKNGGALYHDIDDFDAPHELAVGGKLEVGRTYRAKDGNSYRYVGGQYFMDATRNYVKKTPDEFEGAIFEHGGPVEEGDVVPGARFKNPSATVFIVDDVKEEVSAVDGVSKLFVYSSLEGGQKGNYRDTLKDFTEFMNEEKAKHVMAGGGEAEDGGFYIYGRTQIDNYEIAKMLRELEIASEWDAREGRFRVLEDDEYGDLAFRLQQEMDDRPVYGRIERVMKWGGYAEDGMELEEDEDDLFDRMDELPDEVQEVLMEYEREEPSPSTVRDLKARVNALGYDFDYGLDYEPYGLRKMEKGGTIMAEGGVANKEDKAWASEQVKQIGDWYKERLNYTKSELEKVGYNENHKNYKLALATLEKVKDISEKIVKSGLLNKGAIGYKKSFKITRDGYADAAVLISNEIVWNQKKYRDEWDAYRNKNKGYIFPQDKNRFAANIIGELTKPVLGYPLGQSNAFTYDGNYVGTRFEQGGEMAKGGEVTMNEIFEKYPDNEYYVSMTRPHDDSPNKVDINKKTGKKSESGRDIYEDEPVAKYLETKTGSGKYTLVKNKMEKGGDTKYWIQGATKKKGALRAEAKRMGLIKGDEKLTMEDLKKLEAKGGKTAQRARLAMTLQKMRAGGKVKFKDKVESVKKSLLERKKVPKSVQKDYGKTYSPEEAQESAQRIVGAQTARERLMMRIKKGKKKK